jgi:formate--tetrahydrofolate ligase
LDTEDGAALKSGLVNLQKHVENITRHYGLPCVVAINRFTQDTAAEIALVETGMAAQGVQVVLAEHWAKGGAGAEDLAREVVRLADAKPTMKFVYADADPLWEKMRKIATRIYGAADIAASRRIRALIDGLQQDYGHYPVCVAKTQSSFSTDANLRGAPTGHVVTIREVRLCAGAEFVVMLCDDIMTMPGLPKDPCATRIDVDDDGKVMGLF